MLFYNLIGNEQAKQTLLHLLHSAKVPQAFLFTGPSGIGKKKFALELAKGIMGETHARKIEAGHHPDLRILSPEGKSGMHPLAALQQMMEEMSIAPFEAKAKVFIIDEAERMLATSSNALLKTLEEPQASVYIILITHLPEDILPTIHSRCRRVSFYPIAEKELFDFLKQKQEIIEGEARRIAFLSHGSLAKALSLLNQTTDARRELLIEALSQPQLRHDPIRLSSLLGKIEQLCMTKIEEEEEASTFLLKEADPLFEEVYYWYRDLTALSLGVSSDMLFHLDHLEALQHTSKATLLPSLEKVGKILEECRLAVQRNIKLKTVLEHMFFRLSAT